MHETVYVPAGAQIYIYIYTCYGKAVFGNGIFTSNVLWFHSLFLQEPASLVVGLPINS